MGRKKITYYQVRCDYSIHIGDRELANGDEYHHLEADIVICKNCWNNLMTVETLLVLLKMYHQVAKVGKEYFAEGG